MNFPFGTNGKFIILGVPILKHIRVTLGFLQEMLPITRTASNKITCMSVLDCSLYESLDSNMGVRSGLIKNNQTEEKSFLSQSNGLIPSVSFLYPKRRSILVFWFIKWKSGYQ